MAYAREQQCGYTGTFNDYLLEHGLEESVLGLVEDPEEPKEEEIVPKDPQNEPTLDAIIENAVTGSPYASLLGTDMEDANMLCSVELLLGALEALHIDNARIEIEGGNEVRSAFPFLAAGPLECMCSVDHCNKIFLSKP